MAVTASQGISVNSGSGNLQIFGPLLGGSGVPALPPVNQAQTWFYQDETTGKLYWWNIPSLSWIEVGAYNNGAIVIAHSVSIANMTADTWYTIYDGDWGGFANSDVRQVNVFEYVGGYKYPVQMDWRQNQATGVVEAKTSATGTYSFQFILVNNP